MPICDLCFRMISLGENRHFSKIYLFFIGGYLLYDILLVSAIHQHESALGICPAPLDPASHLPNYPTPLFLFLNNWFTSKLLECNVSAAYCAVCLHILSLLGFPGGASGKEPGCQCRRCKRCELDPWIRKIPWRRAQPPTRVFLPVESHGQRGLGYHSP